MSPLLLYLVPIFFIVALLYATTGQGGGSAFLAIMTLVGLPHLVMPSIALGCNIVATISIVYLFKKRGFLKYRLVLPFLITSVPAAFIGGTIDLPELTFQLSLSIILVVISTQLFFWKDERITVVAPSIKRAFIIGLPIGFILGLIAGTIGIGGGILLMPMLILFKWGNTKEAAVAGGLFTLLNSISGLLGHGTRGVIDFQLLAPLALAVIIGSQIGARLGTKTFSASTIQKIFAALLLIVAIRLTLNVLTWS